MAMSPEPVRGAAVSLPAGRNSVLSGNGLAVASMMTWAAGFPAAEILLQSWPPVALLAARLAMAVAVMVPLWFILDGPSRVLRAKWGRATIIGGFGFGISMFLLILAQKLTDPVTVAIIASCAPLAATLLELAAGTRRLKWNFALGVLVSIVGGLIATSAGSPAQLGLGAVCAIASTGLYCWASMATARDFPELSQIGRTTITFTGGLLMASALCFVSAQMGMDVMPRTSVDAQQVGMLVIYALIAMGLSQVLFIASVGKLGVALASFHINIAPFYVMLIMLMLGDDWNWTRALGAGVVAVAVVLAQDRAPRQSRGSAKVG
ncbi:MULTISPECIES: DMT family transporter [unclassified Ruegeria]|uniref:DMT family transporter n=1 Tax=unclassified Ruegeria TaxID=2625375 RepID=UPI0014911B4E|nr:MULTISPECIES: DMT family transporter [unclassified Ruegeria]NOD48746.1 EamA family transporter [Ruegeria sp. HKCCD5849]NOD51951.1 EamA family transporter [Ruegeria sp. HKCCD5851]NOD66609.1 EamA family transporter [Ruegeria sp. HKCCD7303]